MRESHEFPVEKNEAFDMRGSSLLPGSNSRPVFSIGLWVLGFLVAAGFCLSLSGCGGTPVKASVDSTPTSAALQATPDSVDFGTVPAGSSPNTKVSVSNKGTEPVDVSELKLSDPAFSVDGQAKLPVTLAAGSSLDLKLHYSPKPGTDATGQLSVMASDSTITMAKVRLHGKGSTSNLVALNSLTCSSASMTGAGTVTCTVALSGPAPTGGINVSLSSNSNTVTVPASVTVAASATSSSFIATVSSFSSAQTVTLTATASGLSKTFSLQLNPPVPSLAVSATSLSFGNVAVNTSATKSLTLTSTGSATVNINGATMSGAGFSVSGASFPLALNPGQTLALNVQFHPTNAGSVTGQLTINSNSSTNPTAVINLSGTGTVTTPALSSLTCSNATMTSSGTDACSVVLSSAAPSGGFNVTLASSSTLVSLPSSITVPANATSASFGATVSSFSSTQTVTLTASANAISKSFALQLNAATATLSINASSVSFGSVVLNNPSTQAITLTSTGTGPVTVNSASVTGTGFTVSGSAFPVTLNPGQALTLSVQFDPTTTGLVSGQLTIKSNSSVNPTVVIGLSGTGAPHEVDLTWNAPATGSGDPIAGFHVYRALSGSSSYQLVNSASDVQTSYADTTVQSGNAYDYIVKSFDASGMESDPSNTTTVTIP